MTEELSLVSTRKVSLVQTRPRNGYHSYCYYYYRTFACKCETDIRVGKHQYTIQCKIKGFHDLYKFMFGLKEHKSKTSYLIIW